MKRITTVLGLLPTDFAVLFPLLNVPRSVLDKVVMPTAPLDVDFLDSTHVDPTPALPLQQLPAQQPPQQLQQQPLLLHLLPTLQATLQYASRLADLV